MMFSVKTATEMQESAKAFAASLQPGDVILLRGDLGAGKTTFTQGLAEGLQAKGPVRSPTFSLMNIYPISDTSSSLRHLVHVDLYRIEKESELQELGLEEWMGRADTIMVVEWPREGVRIPSGTRCIEMDFEVRGEKREVIVRGME